MLEREPAQETCKYQLDALLGEPGFLKIVELVVKEVARSWNITCSVARGFVFSAIGEPEALACIYRAWWLAKRNGESYGLAKVIIRRRVIDLLRKDARQTNHSSLPLTTAAIEAEGALDSFHDLVQRSPRAELELRQVIEMVQGAVSCFEAQGRTQQRQAQLLRRYALDDVNYAELAVELVCSEGALRVRVHKAMVALKRHIRECHPELEDLLERDRAPPQLA
jgi:DNA-directed RNA polymerase specialized sigma24 family protein